jgi:hypothetical protein
MLKIPLNKFIKLIRLSFFMGLEDLESILQKSTDFVLDSYSKLYSKYPVVTNYLSSATGVIGGDFLAKQFTENPQVELRDIAFTSVGALAYSYLAPKMIEWSTNMTETISLYWYKLGENNSFRNWFNALQLTAMYFPVNMIYWNYLTIKNQAPLTLEDNIPGAITLGIATLPYLLADYVAITKFNKPETRKWLRPFYSGVELVWNMIFAGGNYLAKKT